MLGAPRRQRRLRRQPDRHPPLAQLNAIRYDLDGNGTASATDAANYSAAFPSAATGMGCQSVCAGYELRQSLNFDTDDDVDSDGTGSYPSWSPVGGTYSATFEGNGRAISHLTIVDTTANAGLFNAVSGDGVVSGASATALGDAVIGMGCPSTRLA